MIENTSAPTSDTIKPTFSSSFYVYPVETLFASLTHHASADSMIMEIQVRQQWEQKGRKAINGRDSLVVSH